VRAASRPVLGRRGVSLAAAIAADLLLGDGWMEPHPVAFFGGAMTRLEERTWRDDRLAGGRYALAGIAASAGAGAGLSLVPGGTAAATYVALAPKGLWSAAKAVDDALARGSLDAARGLLPALAGRDPETLDEKQIVRAVVESVAENTVDAVVAPALWALVAGSPGVLAYRAVNTMDSMVGHRDERHRRYGWASARLDDVAAFVPARLTAMLVALVRPARAAAVARVVHRDAGAHPSPNAGVAEAAFAAALDLRLGGTNSYAGASELRPSLGDGRAPERRDIRRAVRLSADVTLCLGVVAGVPSLVGALR
jgi:adenosylcobinamide-phosphate synthase